MIVPFLDLSRQHKKIGKEISAAINKTVNRCDFILGQDEAIFEKEFAAYCKQKFSIGVNSGTDALFLALLSLGIGKGDEVILPAFTYIATAFAVTFTGAKPVFVDIEEGTYNIDVNKIKSAITKKTKAIIPVHLFGHSADMKPILDIAKKYNLRVVEDAAQAHGAKYRIAKDKWVMAGTMGDIGCFSFYPTKNLGGFGDGGMILTENQAIYKKLFRLRDYGRKSRYEHVSLGYNSRLDTLQAAVLRVKLKHLNEYNKLRRKNARIYNKKLKNIGGLILPKEAGYAYHIYHAYSIRVKNRNNLVKTFKKNNIGFSIYYPVPLHLQKVYKALGYKRGDFPIAERVSREIISLPMYPYLKEKQINFIGSVLRKS